MRDKRGYKRRETRSGIMTGEAMRQAMRGEHERREERKGDRSKK
jgi:hypothetical protein